MKKILVTFGTRPEAIKLAPVIRQLKIRSSRFRTVICVTAQHREMLDQVIDLFDIRPDYDLGIMSDGQDLFYITTGILTSLKGVLEKERPDLIMVQGDTTTSFAASLAAFYLKIPIAHVEAGLRTYDKHSPFPEEKNRHLTGVLADYHFASTEWARGNLLREGVSADKIWVTGNTVIDALLAVVSRQNSAARQEALSNYFRDRWNLLFEDGDGGSRLILVTGHRRESFGEGFKNICLAIREIAENNPAANIVYPVHLNPKVRQPVCEILGSEPSGSKNIFLLDPLDYDSFVYLINNSYIVLTDSGGIQEEAPSLGKPVLVMRDTTERPEGVEAGAVRLVGTDRERMVKETERLLRDVDAYEGMARVVNPYGDGRASGRIADILSDILTG